MNSMFSYNTNQTILRVNDTFLIVKNTKFLSNSGPTILAFNSTLSIDYSVFENSKKRSIYVQLSSVFIKRSDFLGNIVPVYLIAIIRGHLEVVSSTFKNNTVGTSIIYIENANLPDNTHGAVSINNSFSKYYKKNWIPSIILNNKFILNKVAQVIFVGPNSKLQMNNNTLVGNNITKSGGSILAASSGILNIENTIFHRNSIKQSAIMFTFNGSDISCINCNISNNYGLGATIISTNSSHYLLEYSNIHSNMYVSAILYAANSTLEVTNCHFINNILTSNVIGCDKGTILKIKSAIFSSNNAKGKLIFAQSNTVLHLFNTSFGNNSCQAQIVLSNNTRGHFVGCNITGNIATDVKYGSTFLIDSNSSVVIDGSYVTRNIVPPSGAIVYVNYNSKAEIIDSKLTNATVAEAIHVESSSRLSMLDTLMSSSGAISFFNSSANLTNLSLIKTTKQGNLISFWDTSMATFNSCVFENNTIWRLMLADKESRVVLHNCVVKQNSVINRIFVVSSIFSCSNRGSLSIFDSNITSLYIPSIEKFDAVIWDTFLILWKCTFKSMNSIFISHHNNVFMGATLSDIVFYNSTIHSDTRDSKMSIPNWLLTDTGLQDTQSQIRYAFTNATFPESISTDSNPIMTYHVQINIENDTFKSWTPGFSDIIHNYEDTPFASGKY